MSSNNASVVYCFFCHAFGHDGARWQATESPQLFKFNPSGTQIHPVDVEKCNWKNTQISVQNVITIHQVAVKLRGQTFTLRCPVAAQRRFNLLWPPHKELAACLVPSDCPHMSNPSSKSYHSAIIEILTFRTHSPLYMNHAASVFTVSWDLYFLCAWTLDKDGSVSSDLEVLCIMHSYTTKTIMYTHLHR